MAEHPVTRGELAEALGATKVELKAELSGSKNQILEAVREMIRELQNATLERTQEMIRDSQAATLERTQQMIRDSETAVTKAILDRTQEMIRDSQTEVLKAFFSFQEGADIRMRTTEAKLSNVDTGLSQRVAVVERRLQQIEAKLLLNPPPA